MLTDTNAGRKLAEWGAESKKNGEALKSFRSWLTETMSRLRKAFKNVAPDGSSGKAFTKLDKNAKKILADMLVDMSTDTAEKLSTIKAAGMLKKLNTTGEVGVRYSIAGTMATSADIQSLAEAKKQLKNGTDPETIRKETGWFKGYDGMWRYEISDKDMEVDTHGRFHTNPDIRRYNELVNMVYFGDGNATNAEIQELQSLKQNLKGVNMEPNTLGSLLNTMLCFLHTHS